MKARLILSNDTAILQAVIESGKGHFAETVTVKAYDSMAESRAREMADLLGWEVIDAKEYKECTRQKHYQLAQNQKPSSR